MSNPTASLEIEPRENAEVSFLKGIREPEVAFGRCALTGEWGPVVNLDMGNVFIETPNTDKGVLYDERTKEVTFTAWKPLPIERQIAVSRQGLQFLMHMMDGAESPIPAITPESIYQWAVMYKDGNVISQFFYDDAFKEQEQNSGVIVWPEVHELRLLPHHADNETLPQYTYVPDTNKFYRNGSEIDPMYVGQRPEGADIIYCRFNTITMGSTLKPGSMVRALSLGHVTVYQCVGWCVGGLAALGDNTAKKCVICVDERGNWRPWRYTE
jgi:hypothetical protein